MFILLEGKGLTCKLSFNTEDTGTEVQGVRFPAHVGPTGSIAMD